jgi:ATP-dependent DNA helicase RecG
MLNLDTLLINIPRITPKYQKILKKMGLLTIRDFLYYLPFRYDDFRKVTPLSQDFIDQIITVEGKITKTKINRIFKRRMMVVEITLEDENGEIMKAVWFNQPYILDSLPIGSSGRFSGKLAFKGKHFEMINPAWEKASRDATNTGRLVPIYPETVGISSKWIRWQMKMLLPLAKEIPDILPAEIRTKFNLYDIYKALTQLHFPDSREKLIRAQKRMAFEEMLLVQLKTLQVKKDWEGKNSISIKFDEKLIKNFVSKLPWKLTDAQRKASFEILKDLERSQPMNRLLNGDVGSGKTVVAAIAALEIISAGYQVAVMAPTEVLAKQHFESFIKLFENYSIDTALLTNSYKLTANNENISRLKLLKEIEKGKINLVIGTHALIQRDVKFINLSLVIIDEQHRFGVAQRAALQQETMSIDDGSARAIPHLLTMTATPIPRTLAIAFFGSLDLSILDEMPKNRKPIITKIIPPEERQKIYEFIKSEVKKGRQVFVILPLIDESLAQSMTEVRAVTAEYEKLSKEVFPEFKIGLLHGRLKSKEKESVMEQYNDKKIDILVSTSVVEVGIDIPNATVMVIENSERFGLLQLHQFRGRVGRSEHQSYCFLFTEESSERLSIMEKTNDGFKISEKDLELRGPGQFFGLVQSGLPDITMENLTNIKLIKFAREEASKILKIDPTLKKHPLLAEALKKFSDKIHLE